MTRILCMSSLWHWLIGNYHRSHPGFESRWRKKFFCQNIRDSGDAENWREKKFYSIERSLAPPPSWLKYVQTSKNVSKWPKLCWNGQKYYEWRFWAVFAGFWHFCFKAKYFDRFSVTKIRSFMNSLFKWSFRYPWSPLVEGDEVMHQRKAVAFTK